MMEKNIALQNLRNQEKLIRDLRLAQENSGNSRAVIADRLGILEIELSGILDLSVSGGNGADLTMTELRLLALGIGCTVEYTVNS